MTRQEVIEMLIGAGISEPSKETVDMFLNKHQAEVQKEKTLADKYKTESLKVADLQSKLDEINNQNLSEVEKANKLTESANQRIAELEKTIADIELKKSLAEIGIIGEDATNLFAEDGKLNVSILGQIISARETTAKSQRDQELLDGTPNPMGGNTNHNDKTAEDILVDTVAKDLANVNKTSNDIVNAYL